MGFIKVGVVLFASLLVGMANASNGNKNNNNKTENKMTVTELTQEELKAEFSELFTNKLDKKGFNTENIEKIDANKDIIYPITMVKNEASYEMDLNIPVFNITGDAPAEFNNTTQQSFINKANQIMTGENTNSQNSGDVKPNTNQNTNNVTNNESSNSTTNETDTITIDTILEFYMMLVIKHI